MPVVVVSDNGTSLVSAEFKEFLESNDIKQITTAPYHPSSNGQAERYVKIIKDGIKKTVNEKGNLQAKLANFLMFYRRAPHTTTNASPAELMFNRNIRSKLDLIVPSVIDKMSDYQFKGRKRKTNSREFAVGDKVQCRNFVKEPKWLFGVVTERIGHFMYKIQCNDKIIRRHIDHLMRCGDDLVEDAPVDFPIETTAENVNEDVNEQVEIQNEEQDTDERNNVDVEEQDIDERNNIVIPRRSQ